MKMLDPTNAKILEGLGKYGPRNLLSLAKSIRLPPTTVNFRVRKLIEDGHLKIRSKLDYSKLGLMRAILIADAVPGFEDKLKKSIENLGYWTYATRCYGKFNGLYSVFAFPAENKNDLETYLKEAAEFKAFSNYVFHWTTNFHEVAPNFEWFDFAKKEWHFKWQEWIDEVLNTSKNILQTLSEPKSYPAMVDDIDLLILKELEKNGAADYTQLAKLMKTTPQSIRYRFLKHVLKRKLIADHELSIFPYPLQVSEMCCFVIDFKDEKALANFSNALNDKPFVVSYGKVIGQNSLILHIYTPKLEFSRLIDSLNYLTRKNVILNFFYVTLDILSYKRQTVAFELFKDGTWKYDQRVALERLKASIS
jgi:DNA-binding Lrp family transcriptional regulator